MTDDPDESFVIDTLLRARPAAAVPTIATGTQRLPTFAPGDDAALLRDGSVVTVDAMVEDIHWDHRSQPSDVGWKLVAVNASDINAMGCRPTWCVLTLSMPAPLERTWVEQFATGMGDALSTWGIDLVGGDTTRSSGPIVATLTLGGKGAISIARSAARPGDDLWVTGELGGASAGFHLDDPNDAARQALCRPTPPIGFGAALAEAGVVHAMMDLSDGLARDLQRMCTASGTSAQVEPGALPAGPPLEGVNPILAHQVAFGEDYQLLFTANPQHRESILQIGTLRDTRLSRIGTMEIAQDAPTAHLIGCDWPAPTFQHFGRAT